MLKYLTLLVVIVSSIETYNVLVLAPYPLVGQWLYMEEFIKELLSRGDKVTAVTCYNVRRKHENYTDVLIPMWNMNEHCKMNIFRSWPFHQLSILLSSIEKCLLGQLRWRHCDHHDGLEGRTVAI